MRLLQYTMRHPNIYPIVGNHDYFALKYLRWLNSEITTHSIDKIDSVFLEVFLEWLHDGGQSTVNEFKLLSATQRQDILEYLAEFRLFEELTVNQNRFVLVHAGIEHFRRDKPLTAYSFSDLIFTHPDYQTEYFPDRYLVTGHTPTRVIRQSLFQTSEAPQDTIFRAHHHLAIDCGCTYGGQLAALRLDDFAAFYVAGEAAEKEE